MNRLDTALGVFGVLATAFGVGLALAPDVFLVGPVPDLTGRVADTGTTTLMLGAGLVAGLLTFVAARPRGGSSPTGAGDDSVTESFDGSATGFDRSGAGETDLLGEGVTTAIEEGGESWDRVQSQLAATAVEVYASAPGARADRAEQAVARGDWTDDALAAGVTAGEMPLGARLRLWLVPRRERRRRLERTVTALERVRER